MKGNVMFLEFLFNLQYLNMLCFHVDVGLFVHVNNVHWMIIGVY